MKNNLIVFFVFWGQCQLIIAQSSVKKVINGQVITNAISPVEGVNVINTSSKIMVLSDQYGNFSIPAKEGDILSFSNTNYEPFRKFINKKEFNFGKITIDLTPKTIELEEVVINENANINAENLGIIPKDQVKLTSQERKILKTLDFKFIHSMGSFGGSLAFDPFLNAISGRTKILKKTVYVEKKEALMVELQNLFEDKYYIETLKISEELIRAFQYYSVENHDLAQSLNEKNIAMTMFLITGLALEFNKNQLNNEK